MKNLAFFKKDSLGNPSHFGFPHPNSKLDFLHRSINFDSIINDKLFSIKNRMKDLDLDSIRHHFFLMVKIGFTSDTLTLMNSKNVCKLLIL